MTPPRTPTELCLNVVTRTPREAVKVDRVVIAPLRDVKRWVLRTEPRIDWRTFSTALARAPLDERVGVCVLSKRDTLGFRVEGVDRPVASVVVIARPNGQGTVFLLGSLGDNLDSTPRTF